MQFPAWCIKNNMRHYFSHPVAGQGLLETIFAIGVTALVVTAVIAVTVGTLTSQQFNEQDIVATNLAREAIEVVRAQRDSNWLAGQSWDTALSVASSPTDTTAVPVIATNNSMQRWVLDFTAEQPASVYRGQLLLSNGTVTGYYQLVSGAATTDQPTLYRRLLTLQSLCTDTATSQLALVDRTDCQAGDKVGIKIIAHVDWTTRGVPHQVDLEDILYAWK